MPNQSNNPQDYVFQTINGIKKKVKPYDLYKAMHGKDARPAPDITFDGENLIVSGMDAQGQGKTYAFPARSGLPIADGYFNYTPEYQKEKDRGPIPEGNYWVNSDEVKKNDWLEQVKAELGGGHFPGGTDSWGDAKMPIHQDNEQESRTGRDGMYVHGGKEYGSLGCIDLKDKEKEFFKRLEELTPTTGGKDESVQIPLTVKYKKITIEK